MIAVFEDLQESEVSDIYVKKIQKPRSNRNVRTRISVWKPVKLPNRPRPSLIAEENIDLEDDIEIEEDKKGRTTEDSSSMSGECIDRHHEEHHLKVYDPDNETFPIALKYMDVMRQNQISINSIFGKINDFWAAAEGVNLSEEWIGTRGFSILRTWLLDEYKWTNGRPTTNPKTSRPDSFRPEARISSCHHQQANFFAEWTKESVKLQAARRNRGIDKVLTDDKDYFKMITGARLKLEKIRLCRVLRRMTAVEDLRQLQLQLMTMRTTQIHTKDVHAVKWSDNILTAFPLKGIWDLFLLWPDRQRQRRRRITK